MKKMKLSAVGAAFVLIAIIAALVTKSFASKSNRSVSGDGFAVLELFTSEGCSSCPPADELLARIQRQAGDRPIYVLAYHVDYWNRQGWTDAFSSPLFSKRQYQYARLFTGQVYTPQVIVNGKTEFVGGDENAAQSALKDALSGPVAQPLSLKGEHLGGKVKIDYQLQGNVQENQLLIAVVEKYAVSKVTSGENKGRALRHAQIVRHLYTFDLKTGNKGTVQAELPTNFNTNDWELVGFLQNSINGVISAAGRVELLPAGAATTAVK